MTQEQTPKNKNKLYLIGGAVILLTAGYLFTGSDSQISVVENTQPSIEIKQLTIADVWQGEIKTVPTSTELTQALAKQNAASDEEDSEEPEIKLDYNYIYEEIGKIRLNEDGSILLDEQTLSALRKAFPSRSLNFTNEMLNELEDILKENLPGIAGEQAAEIIRNFYEFLVAQRELRDVYRDIDLSTGDHQESLAEIKALRELYLGKEVADQLFEQEDKSAEYMLKAFQIASDKNLSKKEKIEKRNELNQHYVEPHIENWSSRYGKFRSEVKAINASEQSDESKKSAIDKLKGKHFNKDELKIITEANIILDF